jgi:phosphoribosylanthranilate isomerase
MMCASDRKTLVYNPFPFARMRTRIKICGVTRPEDAQLAIRLGADAIGLVFHPASPRFVSQERASEIAASVSAYVAIVGLFVDALPADVERVLKSVPLSLLQFHGDETYEACCRYDIPFTKAIRMVPGIDVLAAIGLYPTARGFIFDTFIPGTPGGTGRVFDWNLIPKGLSVPVILAGGLNSDNVADAIHQVRPYAVDVSGGVEVLKGIKDPQRLASFIAAVCAAD